ncbi:hypothetical protein [Methanobrevibacter sp.]|uniref:hypothetical protein n=1 Tax=Methanobrevibacter sp. TaxID=66852 RepID=UPI00386885D4
MDKRVIGIIIILIIGTGCMYYTASNSNTIGSAITSFSKTIVTLPNGFSVGETTDKVAELYNKNTPERINISDLGKNDSSLKQFENALKSLGKNWNVNDISNSTRTVNDIKVYTIAYKDNDESKYSSFAYVCNHTYCINMSGYDNVDKVNADLDFIIKTIQPDYKQGKD